MDFDKETQLRILRVAADRNDGKLEEELDEMIAHILNMHPEFDEIWKQGSELASIPQEINGQIVNPFVHTVLHVLVDKQIEQGNPEAVGETLERLKSQGMDPHECLHSIIAIFADLHFKSVRRGQQFDQLDYESRLSYLTYEEQEEETQE